MAAALTPVVEVLFSPKEIKAIENALESTASPPARDAGESEPAVAKKGSPPVKSLARISWEIIMARREAGKAKRKPNQKGGLS